MIKIAIPVKLIFFDPTNKPQRTRIIITKRGLIWSGKIL